MPWATGCGAMPQDGDGGVKLPQEDDGVTPLGGTAARSRHEDRRREDVIHDKMVHGNQRCDGVGGGEWPVAVRCRKKMMMVTGAATALSTTRWCVVIGAAMVSSTARCCG